MIEQEVAADEQELAGDSRTRLVNILTLVMLGATVCLIAFYGLVVFNIFNPFAPTPPATLIVLPPMRRSSATWR